MSDRASENTSEYGRSAALAEDRVVMQNVSWETFERLLAERGDQSTPRFAYDEGTLEIISPHMKHENIGALFAQMIIVLVEEFGLERKSVGSMTCKREDLKKGLEPDTSFYIQNESKMRGVTELDLAVHPPPDLMVEIDISRSSMNKTSIYLGLAVPEIWRYDGRSLRIFVLKHGGYDEATSSPIFPKLPLSLELPRFMEMSGTVDEGALMAKFRAWVRASK